MLRKQTRFVRQVIQKAFQRGRAEGLSEGIHTLSKAVQTARRNHYTSVEELVAAGFDETIARAAIELL